MVGATVEAAAQSPILSADSELGPYVVQATLAPGGGPDVSFGSLFAIMGEDTVLVAGTGVVYVFERTPGTDTWQETATLAPAGVLDDSFGPRFAMGEDTVLVAGTGAVYVFERTPGTHMWQETAPLTPSGPVAGFGRALAFDGQTAIVGAQGLAYLFRRTGPAEWQEIAVLTPDDDGAGGDFGATVDIDGDNAIVAAVRGGLFVLPPGMAYVFSRRHSQPERWEATALDIGVPGSDIGFCCEIAINGDTAVVRTISPPSERPACGSSCATSRPANGRSHRYYAAPPCTLSCSWRWTTRGSSPGAQTQSFPSSLAWRPSTAGHAK
jgi:hypothetical protein